jgi:decaprenylphospho-beta-D-ribofuranose 2-oxidase
MQAFNEAWYRKTPRRRSGELQTINRFFYPLDAVKDWNRLYGRTGFLQYQIAVPNASVDTIRRTVDLLADGRAGSFLVVLKRFGPGRGLLSFPIEGWTLTVDIPARHRGLSGLLDEIDRLVVDTGGRTYFAKDARTDPGHIPVMYPELGRWRAIVNEHDPDWVFRSDLERRLQLRGQP